MTDLRGKMFQDPKYPYLQESTVHSGSTMTKLSGTIKEII